MVGLQLSIDFNYIKVVKIIILKKENKHHFLKIINKKMYLVKNHIPMKLLLNLEYLQTTLNQYQTEFLQLMILVIYLTIMLDQPPTLTYIEIG